MILHADHEQNASTSTVRLAGSTGANPFACIAAGIASLWGPSHGGANEAVLKMLADIGHVKNIPDFLEDVKDRNNHAKLMGFGHRVYKNYDPRARIIQKACHDVLSELGIKDDPLLDLAMELEKIALNDKALRRTQALSQRGLLFRHHPEGDGLPDQHVHRPVRGVTHRGLGQPMAGDAGRPATTYRPPAADLHRGTAARLRGDGPPQVAPHHGIAINRFLLLKFWNRPEPPAGYPQAVDKPVKSRFPIHGKRLNSFQRPSIPQEAQSRLGE